VRDDGVTPVQDQLPVVADEHLTVVEVVVLQRLGHAVRRELLGHLADPGHGVTEPLLHVRRGDRCGVPVREDGQAQVGDAGREQLLDVGLHRPGDVGRAHQDVVPPGEVALLGDDPRAAAGRRPPSASSRGPGRRRSVAAPGRERGARAAA
jgi:hypothetical protein